MTRVEIEDDEDVKMQAGVVLRSVPGGGGSTANVFFVRHVADRVFRGRAGKEGTEGSSEG